MGRHKTEFARVGIELISPNPLQPRPASDFEDANGEPTQKMRELIASVAEHGVLQPPLVRRAPIRHDKSEAYFIIAGERRWRAALANGHTHIAVGIRDVSELETGILALVENIERDDLSPLAEAEQIERLMKSAAKRGHALSRAELAQKLGGKYTRGFLNNRLALLKINGDIRDMVQRAHDDERDAMSHALLIRSVKNRDDQRDLIEMVDAGASLTDLRVAAQRLQSQRNLHEQSLRAPDPETQARQSEHARTGGGGMSRGRRITGHQAAEMRQQVSEGLMRAEGALMHLRAWATVPGSIPAEKWRAVRLLVEQIEAQSLPRRE